MVHLLPGRTEHLDTAVDDLDALVEVELDLGRDAVDHLVTRRRGGDEGGMRRRGAAIGLIRTSKDAAHTGRARAGSPPDGGRAEGDTAVLLSNGAVGTASGGFRPPAVGLASTATRRNTDRSAGNDQRPQR